MKPWFRWTAWAIGVLATIGLVGWMIILSSQPRVDMRAEYIEHLEPGDNRLTGQFEPSHLVHYVRLHLHNTEPYPVYYWSYGSPNYLMIRTQSGTYQRPISHCWSGGSKFSLAPGATSQGEGPTDVFYQEYPGEKILAWKCGVLFLAGEEPPHPLLRLIGFRQTISWTPWIETKPTGIRKMEPQTNP